MYTQTNTARLQSKLANYCRTGEEIKLPGARNDRLHHYRRLVYNVVKGILDDAFPITREILGKGEWDDVAKTFFATHNCQTPQVWKLPGEFYAYALNKNLSEKLDKPWLHDLLLLEWIEIKVYTMPDISPQPYQNLQDKNILQTNLVFNQEHEFIELKYPVHLKAAQNTLSEKGHYNVLVLREPETGRVQFINLNPFSKMLLDSLLHDTTVNQWYQDVRKVLNPALSESTVKDEAKKFLVLLHEKQFLFGVQKKVTT